jgi:DNA (cytosine-5)-methyltransferase 1
MKFGSVCSGIEAATVAWEPLGMKASFFAEIEKFPSAVLRHHYPDTPNLGDFTKIGSDFGPVDILVGGTPCQSFSVAGKRAGLDDPRGNLAIEFLRLAQRLRARWLVWENVPGVLSSNGGRDFGTFLRLVGQCGYGFAYRVLDAQYFGVPQRRRRVFLVGYFGDWRPAATVLFERESLSWNPKPSRETGEELAARLAASVGGCNDPNRAGAFIPEVAGALGEISSKRTYSTDEAGTFIPVAFSAKDDGQGLAFNVSPTLRSGTKEGGEHWMAVTHYSENGYSEYGKRLPTLRAFNGGETGPGGEALIAAPLTARCGKGPFTDPVNDNVIAPTLSTKNEVASSSTQRLKWMVQAADLFGCVRRLTPRECERLQGFEDDYTLIPWRGKAREECPDGPRYRSLGNSMAVPCMRWIGERIRLVDGLDRLLADVLRVEDGDDPCLVSEGGETVNERVR